MLTTIHNFFAAPVFPADPEKTRNARVLNTLVVSFLVVLCINLLVLPIFIAQKVNSLVFIGGFFVVVDSLLPVT